MPLSDITELRNIYQISREPIGKDKYMVNTIRQISPIYKTATRQMAIIAGPIDEEKHGFYAISPGQFVPPFPTTIEKLINAGYKKNELEEKIKLNEEYKKFWDNHIIVKD